MMMATLGKEDIGCSCDECDTKKNYKIKEHSTQKIHKV